MESRNQDPGVQAAQRAQRPQRRSRRVLTGLVAMIGAVAMVAAGCGSEGSSNLKTDQTITIGYIDWAEDVALTHLFEHQLQDAHYSVETKQYDDVGTLFSDVASGDVDMFLDVWLPTTHAKYWDQYGGRIDDLGVWYDNASLHLTVPSYVDDVDSIADVKGHADEFDGVITGIESSAGISDRTKNHVLPDYDLSGALRLEENTTPEMASKLKNAVDARKPILVTLWHPHWAYSRYDLKDLKDPKQSLGGTENLHIVASRNFREDFPNVADAAADFTIDDEHLESMEDAIQSAGQGGASDAVEEWTKDNQDFVEQKFGTLSNLYSQPH